MVYRHDSVDDESILAELFEAAPDGELVVDAEGCVRRANAEAHRILGWPPGTLIERKLEELLPERFHAARPVAGHPALLSSRRTGNAADEFVTHRRDGSEVPIEIILTSVRGCDDQRFHVEIHDVSARRETARKLCESEETFRLLVDGVRDYAIFFLDPHGHVMTWNAGAERIMGYRTDEVVGQSIVRFYLPQDVIAGTPNRLLRRAAEAGVATDEGMRVRRGGSRFWAHAVLTALRDESGNLRGFAQVTRDISEQKHAEQAMAMLADASRLMAESLDAEQVLFAVIHTTVPAFADGVSVHVRDSQGELRLGPYHAANPELLAAVQELQRAGNYRVPAPSRRVMRTGRSELHPQLTPEWLAGQDADARFATVTRRFGTPRRSSSRSCAKAGPPP